jgi:hypothetical protein
MLCINIYYTCTNVRAYIYDITDVFLCLMQNLYVNRSLERRYEGYTARLTSYVSPLVVLFHFLFQSFKEAFLCSIPIRDFEYFYLCWATPVEILHVSPGRINGRSNPNFANWPAISYPQIALWPCEHTKWILSNSLNLTRAWWQS